MARENLEKSQDRYKHYYDRTAKKKVLNPGDKVLVLLPTDNNKLLMQWKGPYDIVELVGVNDYAVTVNGKRKLYHANLLKKYFVEEDSEAKKRKGVLEKVCSAVVEESEDDSDVVEDLPEVGGYRSKEDWKDVKFGEGLDEVQLRQLNEVVEAYSPVFSDKPGTTSLIEHRVNLTSSTPVRTRPYVVPFAVRESLRKDIEEMLDMGVIRQSSSSYSSPVVVVKKPDGSNRVCVDYRKLNKITLFDPEPMTSVSELFHKLSGSKVFSKIDLSKGYWQIPVAKEDIEKTAFVTPDGAFEFLKMPFGMMNSGATLVRAMRKLINGMSGVDSYVDDILVYTKTWEEHVKVLKELFSRMKSANFTARPSKCVLGTTKVNFVGHVLEGMQSSMSPQEVNIDKVKNAPRPKTKKEVRSFLGLTGFYREYIPSYASIAVPLTEMTRKGQPNNVQWSPAAENAYLALKDRIVSKPILRLPDQAKTFILRTDASDLGIGAMLLQESDGKLFPVSFASKKLSGSQQKYSTIEKECLALVWAIRRYRPYLYGARFVLQTDHEPLTYLNQALTSITVL